ncbi:MAG: ECF-type sigma factor [Caulobacter sp.]|nr:ECF-type sigma factor [Caulobacter sp.]
MSVGESATSLQLLQAWRSGDDRARDQLFQLFYPDLVQVAASLLRRESSVSLASGDLVHESVLRLIRLRQIEWEDRSHFMAMAARFMRRALIDHVRAKQSDKRGHVKVELTTRFAGHRPLDLQNLDNALVRLSAIDPVMADIVEMRYFGGMTTEDVAQVLHVSEPTVKRRWNTARVWLREALDNPA